MKKYLLITVAVMCVSYCFAQQDSSNKNGLQDIYSKLTSELAGFKPDTAAAPNDAITKTIVELRKNKGGFNINEAINFKLKEDLHKGDIKQEQYDKFFTYFNEANGKRWLDNAVVWIYRKTFTHKELKQLLKFYKTSAGRKMSDNFPVIIAKTMAAGEWVKSLY